MIKKLFVILPILACATHVCATSPTHENKTHNDKYLNEKIKEIDAKLSEYLHIPIKKFGSILNDIADYIYSEEFAPLHKEIKLLQGDVAQLKSDLKEMKTNVQTLTKQVKSLEMYSKVGQDKIARKWN